MSYEFKEFSYPSKDGIHKIHAELYVPKEREYKGIVQIAHGMVDYVGRYRALAEFLTDKGYVVAGNDHLGHGGSVSSKDDFGYFAKKGGAELVISDLHTMNEYLKTEFPTLPIVLLGHSMGSFIARLYVEKYPHTVKGAVIHGTAGPNRLLPFGKALSAIVSVIRGERYRSKIIKSLAFSGYNSKFTKEEGSNAWLTRDTELVKNKDLDERSGFIFTTSGYRDLFRFLGRSNSKDWFNNYPKELPTLIVSGDMDPVGAYGKGPSYVYKKLLISGCREIELKLYPGARHELFNETNRQEVFEDLAEWLRLNIE